MKLKDILSKDNLFWIGVGGSYSIISIFTGGVSGVIAGLITMAAIVTANTIINHKPSPMRIVPFISGVFVGIALSKAAINSAAANPDKELTVNTEPVTVIQASPAPYRDITAAITARIPFDTAVNGVGSYANKNVIASTPDVSSFEMA